MMNASRDGRRREGTARVGKRHDLKTGTLVRVTLPTTGVARRDRISPAKSLDAELSGASVVGRRCSSISPSPKGGEEGGRKRWSPRSDPAVQLRVCPVLG